jgi:hypothetical protein
MLQVIQICGNNFGKTEDTDDPQLDKVIYNRICPSFEVTSHPEAGFSESSKVRTYSVVKRVKLSLCLTN